jgi:hypothetical protein
VNEPLETGRIEIRPMPGIEELAELLSGASMLAARVKASQPADSELHELASELERRLERFNTRPGSG